MMGMFINRLQGIVYQILSQGDESFAHISDYSPFYEIDRTWEDDRISSRYTDNHQRLGWRVFNTHLRWDIMPKADCPPGDSRAVCKYIYILRDGRDACTSFFHHLSNQADAGPFEGNFDEFVRLWLQNKVIFGSWAKHVKNWVAAAKNPKNNILLLTYEDLLSDTFGCILKISAFLGQRVDPEYLRDNILPHVTIEYMREHKHQYEPISVAWKEGFQFIRKGIVGDHKSVFTAQHDALYAEMLSREFPDGFQKFLDDEIKTTQFDTSNVLSI